MNDDYEELIGKELGAWLERPPVARCSACARKTWEESAPGTRCGMTQPNGHPCPGRFIEATRAAEKETPG